VGADMSARARELTRGYKLHSRAKLTIALRRSRQLAMDERIGRGRHIATTTFHDKRDFVTGRFMRYPRRYSAFSRRRCISRVAPGRSRDRDRYNYRGNRRDNELSFSPEYCNLYDIAAEFCIILVGWRGMPNTNTPATI